MPARKTATKKTATKKAATKSKSKAQPHLHYHKDGSLWGKGQLRDGVMTGYWEWYRKDGGRMRTGSFEDGVQVGEWTTYDRKGKVVKVTVMKPKAASTARTSRRPRPA